MTGCGGTTQRLQRSTSVSEEGLDEALVAFRVQQIQNISTKTVHMLDFLHFVPTDLFAPN